MEFLTALKKPIIFWQYKDSTKFAKLLNLYISLLMKMYPYEWWEFLDLDVAEGYALDIIGQRLGLPRPKDDPSTAGIYDVAEYESCYYDYSTRDIDLVKDDTYRYMLKLRIMMYQPWRASSVKSLYDALEFAYPGKKFEIIRTPSYFTRTGPVGYTVVGSPTIADGVASDFSGSSYLQSDSIFPGSSATSLEFGTKINVSDLTSTSTIASSISATIPFHLALRTNGKIRLYPGVESTSRDTSFVFSTNTDYYIRLIWNSSGWKLQYSTDGDNYITDFENYSPSNSPKNNYVVIGRNYVAGGGEAFLGMIDLKETYIKINNAIWFGKTQERSKDIVELHALSYMNYPERRALFSNVVVAPMATTLLKYYDYNNI